MRTTGAERRVAIRLAAIALIAALAATPMPVAAGEPETAGRTMAITVDDLPAIPMGELATMRRITDGMLATLRRHQATAVGFVNENKLEPAGERGERVALLRAWLEAGHDLGNHTYSHPDLQRVPLEEYQQDVVRGEPAIRELLAARGRAPVWFRHPFTHSGPTREVRRAFEAFLAGRGYRVAPFSIENADYVFDAVRRAAFASQDAATLKRLDAAYIDHTLAVTAAMERLARESFGREIPQVLLIHSNGTNAGGALDTVLARLRARGYRFVSLADALADGAWRAPDDYVGPQGPSWLHRFRVAKGLPLRLDLEPDPPAWVLDRYREVQAR
jgi:peptidoglycan/xylan/chitin deacetylase (PgdA/CDA1 family)